MRGLLMAASVLLCYPDERMYGLRGEIRRAVPSLTPLLDHVDEVSRQELEAHYVEVFDLRNRCSLYMTYYTDGDTRRRGTSLVALQRRYRDAGYAIAGRELSDFLPIMLEFCAAAGPDLLQENRPGLELLRLALLDRRTPYAAVLSALCDALPGASPRDRAEAIRLARTGPPAETVGVNS